MLSPALLVLQCTLSLAIRVPVAWQDSEVKQSDKPQEYFQYTANKPQFAVDVSKFHDVKAPEKHYQSYPVEPHTGLNKPDFGKHQLLNSDNPNYKPYQQYVKEESNRQANPVSNYYEVFHPYKAEVPALEEIYKDPVLHKIRNDVRDSKNRLQQYEHDAGEPNVEKDEYLENPEVTDKKRFPIRNVPARYEIHRPQRRPTYYRPIPIHNQREHYLNQKLKHPWNQNYAKVTPTHYRPLKNHLHRLRQQHALTYDDERNEYPQEAPPERYADRPDGYDIYEKGKDNYNRIRNNFDESINKAILKNRPAANQNLEFKEENKDSSNAQEEEETFVPIKNYAQVRKTETYKHLPKAAAFEDAKDFEELRNAPRLREAIKSSKNQVVYSEEGYEDAAYDHGGEQKHASDHEHHGGFLKEDERSKGKYKIPTLDIGYADEGKSTSREKLEHGEKWNDELKKTEDENDSDEYSEGENDYSDKIEAEDITSAEYNDRNKRENEHSEEQESNTDNLKYEITDSSSEHELAKREANFNVSELRSKSTLPNAKKVKKIQVNKPHFNKYLAKMKKKYPYYFKDTNQLNKNSPLRYAENLKLMPKKIRDDSAFYNSRIALQCPEVETKVNPIPDKFDKDKVANSDDGEDDDDDDDDDDEDEEPSQGEDAFQDFKNKQRLKGLGDKIDCLKAKYFGEDPLDSPFFKEDLINNPLPLSIPNSEIFSLPKSKNHQETKTTEPRDPRADIYEILNKLFDNTTFAQTKSNSTNTANIKTPLDIPGSASPVLNYNHYVNKEGITKPPITIRKKRSATFMYEPYKVIKESQSQDTKKLTNTGNVSPLIKKLQTRQIIDKATSSNSKLYKDIGKNDRPTNLRDAAFVDVSVDKRRGEPRYELEAAYNHKDTYSPTENKTSISTDDYKKIVHANDDPNDVRSQPYFDVSKYLPTSIPMQDLASSNTVERKMQSTSNKPAVEEEDEEDYEEYDDDEEDEEEVKTTTTTTNKPTTKSRVVSEISDEPEPTKQPEKLRLVTRFHTTTTVRPEKHTREQDVKKYREKKKKSTKSTLVTDTETYGDDHDDMREKEIDDLIGVKQDMREYTPDYEKEERSRHVSKDQKKDDEGEDDDDEDEDDDDEEDDEEDDDDEDDDDEEDEDDNSKHDDKIDDKHHNNAKSYQSQSRHNEEKLEIATSEPTKRTLMKTTEPTTTTEVLKKAHDQQPTIFKKKIEIHKELPADEKAPHTTFKQDIKEVEVVKELVPKRKVIKNLEALELYKDDNLAKDINQLGGVEIFSEKLNLETGPRHGGNYRMIKPDDSDEHNVKTKLDTEVSQSQIKTLTQAEASKPKSRSDVIRSRNRSRNTKLVETIVDKKEDLSSPRDSNTKKSRSRPETGKSAKLIEFQDDEEDHHRNMHGGNFKSYNTRDSHSRPMHGGNYRSAKIIQSDSNQNSAETTTTKRTPARTRSRKSEAELLNTYARVVPELTTAPAFILDPSKRQYYYVD